MRHVFSALVAAAFIALTGCSTPPADPFAPKASLGADSTDTELIRLSIRYAHQWADSLKDEKIIDRLNTSPEMFAWLDFKFLELFLDAYEYTGHPMHLERFAAVMDRYLTLMTEGPDGYRGWYGPHIPGRRGKDNPLQKIDEIQMNFAAMRILARWARLAGDDTALKSMYADKIAAVRKICEKDIFEKFDARKRFVDLGEGRGGVYRFSGTESRPGLTLPFEKLSIMFHGIIQLYKLTNDPEYLQRAADIGMRYKRALGLKDGHYTWNYWEPTTKDDADLDNDKWRHWVNPEPQGGWHNVTTSIAVTLYQYGLVFDDTDMARFIKTQKEVCWDGNLENPGYFVTSGDTIPTQFVKKSAILSYGISLYDPQLTELAFGTYAQARAAAPKKKPDVWGCGVGQRNYLAGKYLEMPVVKNNPQPYKTAASEKLAALYTYTVEGAGNVTPEKPSAVKVWPR